jgi:pimeloyl-ACP methyl ester carboxylesterase
LPTGTQKAEENFDPSETHSQLGLPPWKEYFVDLAGGRMRYLRAGTGRPLILVHGLMGYSFSWRFSITALAPHATLYAIDNLGAGFSKAPDGMDCSMRAAAERVLQFVDVLGMTDFDLLGTSYGGAVAMMAAALCVERHDARLKRLVLVAPVNPWSRHGRWLAPFVGGPLGSLLFRNTVARWRALDHLWLRRLFADGSKIPPDSLEGYRQPIHENRVFGHAQSIVRTWTADLAELEQALTKIRNYPTLLMWGTKDRAVSFRSAERLRQNFRDSQLVALKGVGHLPYEEAPEEFNRELIKFLTTTLALHSPHGA